MKSWFEKLEKFNVLVEVIRNMWPAVRVVMMIASAMLVTFMVMNTRHKDELDQYITQYDEFKTRAENANSMVDELRLQVAEKEHQTKAAMSRAAALSAQSTAQKRSVSTAVTKKDSLLSTISDSIEMARVIIPAQEEIIDSQYGIIKTQDTEISELRSVITSEKEINVLLTTAVDSLQLVIRNIPPAPKNPNKILGLPLPTRKQTFITGIVVGAVSSWFLLK